MTTIVEVINCCSIATICIDILGIETCWSNIEWTGDLYSRDNTIRNIDGLDGTICDLCAGYYSSVDNVCSNSTAHITSKCSRLNKWIDICWSIDIIKYYLIRASTVQNM